MKKSDTEVLLIGGYNSERRVLLFDTQKIRWTVFDNVISGRFSHSCALFENKVIIIGGRSISQDKGNTDLNDVTEIIDLKTMKARIVPNSDLGHDNKLGIAITDIYGQESLIAFGGHLNSEKRIYIWDSKNEVWHTSNFQLSERKYGFGYAVVPRSLVCTNEH